MIGAEKLRVAGDARIEGKLTVTGSIDPTDVVLSGGTALFFESNDGATAPLSGASTGRIRYNNSTGKFQTSVQGAAYVDIGGGGGVTGSGTIGRVPQWTGATALGDAPIYVSGGNVGVGAAPGAFVLDVTGDTRITGKLTVTGALDPTSVLLSGGTALYYESNNGVTAPVSGANTGRIRYNDVTGFWEQSTRGSTYASVGDVHDIFRFSMLHMLA